jgi:hypothetical protein
MFILQNYVFLPYLSTRFVIEPFIPLFPNISLSFFVLHALYQTTAGLSYSELQAGRKPMTGGDLHQLFALEEGGGFYQHASA